MNVTIIGAAGMLGAKLAARLAADGTLAGRDVARMTLVDVVEPPVPHGWSDRTTTRAADLSEPGVAATLIADRPDVVYHLAAIVSGEAEADLDKGYRINLDGTRYLFDAVRAEHDASGGDYVPRVVYSSSVAVFGAPFPERIDDDFQQTPRTSYGAQKLMGELMLSDYTRRGIMDGVGLRLPTICVRPGKPNAAASGFFSGILREPIAGREAVLPVPDTVRHWFASPRAAVGFLVHAAGLDGEAIGPRRNLNLPGLSATVADQLESLGRVVGPEAVALVRREPDETIMGIVGNWAEDFDPARATALGFEAESSFDEILRVYLEDDAPESARRPAAADGA